MHSEDNEFCVTLVSNASTDIYPNNHVFKFTNVLAKQLALPRHEKWRVCLQSISLTNTNDEPEFIASQRVIEEKIALYNTSINKAIKTLAHMPEKLSKTINLLFGQTKGILEKKIELFNTTNSLFIECNQIIPKYGQAKILSSFIIPPTCTDAQFYHYEPITEEYFDLANTDISQFDIKILNANKEKISRTASQPTIIVLKFKKMDNTLPSYSITIDNGNESPEKFYAKFPLLNTLETATRWEIAVSRVSFIPLLKKFPSGGYSISLIKDTDDFLTELTTQTWDEYFSKKEKHTAFLNYSEYYTPATLLGPISEAISAISKKANLQSQMYLNVNDLVTIIISSKETIESTKKKPYLLVLPEELIYVLGFDNEGIIFNNGYGALPSYPGKKLTARRKVNINFLIPQNLLLYVDCVQPSLVGNAYGKYLTNIPIPIQNNSNETIFDLAYTVYEPKNLEFHPIQQNDINHVLIQLLKVDGKAPEFVTNQVKIFISFLIRKVRR